MKKILIALLPVTIFFATACNKILKEEAFDFLSPANFPVTASDADVALNGAYHSLAGDPDIGTENMMFDGYGAGFTCEMNDLVHDGFTSDFSDGSRDFFTAFWKGMYQGINSCNSLIASLEKKDPAVDNWVPAKLAEAKALRALYYFYLVRWFGDIPLVTTPTTTGTVTAPRTSVTDVYKLIVEDLTYAENKLPDAINDGRFKKGSAKALLAQVYAAMAGWRRTWDGKKVQGDQANWALARDKAKEVIDLGTYSFENDYTNVFKKLALDVHCNEILLDVQFSTNSGSNFAYLFGPESYGNQHPTGGGKNWLYKTNIEWIRRINPNDKRKNWNISDFMYLDYGWNKVPQSDSNRFILVVYPKWPEGDDSHQFYWYNYLYNWPLLRLAETKLLYAEAANEAGGVPTTEAYTQLNDIRIRSGLAPLSGLSKDSFKEAIMEERAIELCGEGIRYFDLQRWGNFKEKIDANKEQGTWLNSSGAGVDEKWTLWPIPQRDIDANGWEQNQGW